MMAEEAREKEAAVLEREDRAHLAEEHLENEAAASQGNHGTFDFVESGHDDRVWQRVLHAASRLPGARVNRQEFLKTSLDPIADTEQIAQAIATRPARAGIGGHAIEGRASALITKHVARASGVSFASGIPGGFAMMGAIPPDLAQRFFHFIVMAQELAYLYGWPDMLHEGELDDAAQRDITVFIGAMIGIGAANQGLRQMSARAVEHHASAMLAKRVGRHIGVTITKDSLTRGFARAIPVLGGFIGAGMTASTMMNMAHRLKKELAQLDYALVEEPITGEGS